MAHFACSVCRKWPAVPNFVWRCSKNPPLHEKRASVLRKWIESQDPFRLYPSAFNPKDYRIPMETGVSRKIILCVWASGTTALQLSEIIIRRVKWSGECLLERRCLKMPRLFKKFGKPPCLAVSMTSQGCVGAAVRRRRRQLSGSTAPKPDVGWI